MATSSVIFNDGFFYPNRKLQLGGVHPCIRSVTEVDSSTHRVDKYNYVLKKKVTAILLRNESA
jgi:hypothetical protein